MRSESKRDPWTEERPAKVVHDRGHPLVNKGDGWYAYLNVITEPHLLYCCRWYVFLGMSTSINRAKELIEQALERLDQGYQDYAIFPRGPLFRSALAG
jgi:hypothetical protein